ncbi:hypothetical protein, partial [Klebsiella michiganensis]
LRAGSPGKAFTPQPGECAAMWHCCGFYPLALRLAGLRFINVCGPVARVRRLRRNPGNVPRRSVAAASTRLRCA